MRPNCLRILRTPLARPLLRCAGTWRLLGAVALRSACVRRRVLACFAIRACVTRRVTGRTCLLRCAFPARITWIMRRMRCAPALRRTLRTLRTRRTRTVCLLAAHHPSRYQMLFVPLFPSSNEIAKYRRSAGLSKSMCVSSTMRSNRLRSVERATNNSAAAAVAL